MPKHKKARAQRGARSTAETGSAVLQEGMAHHAAGRLDSAEHCYRAIKRRDPAHADAQRLRGLLAHQRGEPDIAIALLQHAVKLRPADPIFHHTLAEALKSAGRLRAALKPYRRAVELDPERIDNHMDLAAALGEAGDSDRALAVYAKLAPNVPAARQRMITLHYERGELRTAHALLDAWAAEAPADAETRQLLAETWNTVGEPAKAIAIYRALAERHEDDAAIHGELGGALQARGDFEAAEAHFERALTLDPRQAWVYAALMSNRGYTPSAERRQTMQRLIDAPDTPDTDRAHLHFALGQWHDRRDEAAEAFSHFERGNRIQAGLTPFNRPEFDDRVDRILGWFSDPSHFEPLPVETARAGKPVFVVGMPRSGTSLVEQILASHPQIHGAGELEDVRHLVRELPALDDRHRLFPECLAGVPEDTLIARAARYRDSLDARAPDAARVVDKMPFNLMWLGLIARLWPDARIIHCRREPMDNALSCYFQIFSTGLRFTYDLTHLGHVYRQHERMMAHWRAHLPLPIHTVDYEQLVSEPEPAIRALVDFVELEWDDACLAPHRTARNVRTASVWQVRQPIYGSSVARWRAYEPWLGPLREALAETPG